jgi:holo-[acyl-carrier protein] synthase
LKSPENDYICLVEKLTGSGSFIQCKAAQTTVILGTGIDLCEVARMGAKVGAPAADFLTRVFLPAEITYCQTKRHPAEHFAARFAAKEALVKALAGSGARGSFWQDIEVVNHPDGRPEIQLHGRIRKIAADFGVRRVFVSLSHTREMAVAKVVLES